MTHPLLLSSSTKPVIFLMGPTASGKTAVATQLLEHFPCELINTDAAQVYRGMDIGTAKPSPEELKRTPHRLIDFVEPQMSYSAANFSVDAKDHIKQIHAMGRIPVLVGGSMFYFKALEKGLPVLPQADGELRKHISAQAQLIGWAGMHVKLAQIDPQIAQKIQPSDSQRIQRALEIYHKTGKPPSKVYLESNTQPLDCPLIKLVIAPYSRKQLHQRIEARFHLMLADGLLEEVKELKQSSVLNLDLASMRTVGYRQVWQYLEGNISYDEMIFKALAATRQLAKRQLTWLRRESGLVWFSSPVKPDGNQLFEAVYRYLD